MKHIYFVLLHKLFVSKRFYIWLLILIGLGIKTAVQESNPLKTTEDAILTVYYQIAHPLVMNWFIIPCFLFLLGIVTNVFHRNQIILKYSYSNTWWKDQTVVLLLLSLLHTFAIHTVIAGVAVTRGGMESLTNDFILFLGLSSTMQVLGFTLLGVGYYVITLLTNSYIGFFATILFINFVDVVKRLLKLEFNTLQEYMSASFYTGKPGTIMTLETIHLFTLSSFLLVAVLLYFIGNILSHEKDYFWSR
ncbi:hypothetical protein ACFQ49_07955 [Kroppenstedtia eburnea]|uniref:hypothetical protein n=1 Tax=Kroppenstedtia eburnea TaxID=714067 RepID=UPI00362559F0